MSCVIRSLIPAPHKDPSCTAQANPTLLLCTQDDAWVQWQRQHACEAPPPPQASEAVMLGGVVVNGPGGPSPGGFGRSSYGGGGGSYRSPAAVAAGGYGGGGGARANDVCYRCRQPGHW